jgi:hypothetical protein
MALALFVYAAAAWATSEKEAGAVDEIDWDDGDDDAVCRIRLTSLRPSPVHRSTLRTNIP